MRQDITVNGKEIILVGTAHISQESVVEVEEVIRETKPDTVGIELCETRYQSTTQRDRWENMDIIKVIKEGKAPLLMANLVVSAFQKKMGDKLGVKPGAELQKAAEISKELEIPIALVDREVSVTLKRVWRKLSTWEKVKLSMQMLAGTVDSPDITEEEVERLKSQDMLSEVIDGFAQEFPMIKKVLIDERDQYLASKIMASSGDKIVAVVGAGHVPGILKHLDNPPEIAPLEEVPAPGKLGKILKWGIPLAVIGAMAYGFFKIDLSVGLDMIKFWFLANGVLAGLGAILAGGHILTIISAILAAPITSLNPAIAAGWVAGLVEAWVRKPKVADFENLAQDITTVKGFRRNEITKILLVVVLCNIGSMIGTIVGVPYIMALLGNA